LFICFYIYVAWDENKTLKQNYYDLDPKGKNYSSWWKLVLPSSIDVDFMWVTVDPLWLFVEYEQRGSPLARLECTNNRPKREKKTVEGYVKIAIEGPISIYIDKYDGMKLIAALKKYDVEVLAHDSETIFGMNSAPIAKNILFLGAYFNSPCLLSLLSLSLSHSLSSLSSLSLLSLFSLTSLSSLSLFSLFSLFSSLSSLSLFSLSSTS
jgi:hypothetical protein